MSEDELIRDVDEAMRQDKLKAQWAALAPFVIAVVTVVILGVGGTQLWRYMQTQQAMESSVAYFSALQAKQAGDDQKADALLQSVSHNGFALMASLHLVDEQDVAKPSNHELVSAVASVVSPQENNRSHTLATLEKEQLAMRYYQQGDVEKAHILLTQLNETAGAPSSQMERIASLLSAMQMLHPELEESSIDDAAE